MWIYLVVAAFAVLVWRLATKPADCVIRIRRGHVRCRSRITVAHRRDVEAFLGEQFAHVGRCRVEIRYPRGSRPLQVRVRGSLHRGERQLIRNYLLSVL